MRFRPELIACLAGLALATPSLAQRTPPSSQSLTNPTDCREAANSEPATGPAPASRDGTAPGNTGSTGWSGGTGGSQIGTNAAGATRASRTWQPATARGLDPIGNPLPPARNC